MATVQSFNEDEDENGQPVTATGSEQVVNGPVTGVPGGGTSPEVKGSGWTNLQSYVTANAGNDGVMGGAITSNVGSKATNASNQANTYQNDARSAVDRGTVKRDDNIINDISSNPNAIVSNAEKKAQFDRQMNAAYGGPNAAQEIGGYQDVESKYGSVKTLADNAKSTSGRETLLNDTYGRPSYSSGEKNLDNFILGAGDQGKAAISNLGSSYGSGSEWAGGWQGILNDVSGKIDQGKTETADTRAKTRAALDTNVAGIEGTFDTFKAKAATTNAANTAAIAYLNPALTSSDPGTRADAFRKIGLDPAVGEWLVSQGYNAQQLIAQGKATGAGDYATDADISRMKALHALAGKNTDASLITRTGEGGAAGTGAAYTVKAKAIADAKAAKDLQDAINKRFAEKDAARRAAFENAKKTLSMDYSGSGHVYNPETEDKGIREFLKGIGIDPEIVTQARLNNINLADFLRGGKNINTGDVTTNEERAGWAALMNSLGLNPGSFDINDNQDEGDDFTFDLEAFRRALPAASTPAPAPPQPTGGTSINQTGKKWAEEFEDNWGSIEAVKERTDPYRDTNSEIEEFIGSVIPKVIPKITPPKTLKLPKWK
jgi:hypothetical protein